MRIFISKISPSEWHSSVFNDSISHHVCLPLFRRYGSCPMPLFLLLSLVTSTAHTWHDIDKWSNAPNPIIQRLHGLLSNLTIVFSGNLLIHPDRESLTGEIVHRPQLPWMFHLAPKDIRNMQIGLQASVVIRKRIFSPHNHQTWPKPFSGAPYKFHGSKVTLPSHVIALFKPSAKRCRAEDGAYHTLCSLQWSIYCNSTYLTTKKARKITSRSDFTNNRASLKR